MPELSRRDLLAGGAATGALALGGCGDLSSGNRVLGRRVTPDADGNPATVAVAVDPGTVLTVETASDRPTVFTLVHGDSGVSLASGGTGLVYDQSLPVESDPVPDSETQNALVVAMHPGDAVDVRISRAGERAAETPANADERLREEVAAVSERIDAGSEAETVAAVGPLWLWLFEKRLALVSDRVDTGPARAELSVSSETVYGRLLRQRVDAWVDQHVTELAGDLASATAATVSTRTDTPAEAVETALRERIEAALSGDVTWSAGEPAGETLGPTGGTLAVVVAATLELAFEGSEIVVDAPVRFTGSADGESVPASAEIRDAEVLAEQITVE